MNIVRAEQTIELPKYLAFVTVAIFSSLGATPMSWTLPMSWT